MTLPGGYKCISWRYGGAVPGGESATHPKKKSKKGKKPMKESDTHAALRHLYCKEHGKKNDSTYPAKKTLFVLNPPMGSPESLTGLLTTVGEVQSVHMTTLGMGGGGGRDSSGQGGANGDGSTVPAALVVFSKNVGLRSVLDLDRVLELELPSQTDYGIQKWEHAYTTARPTAEHLQESIDKDLQAFDDKISQERAMRLAGYGEEDEDGWTVVNKTGNKDASNSSSKAKVPPQKKRQKEKELQNFYRFQMKEKRKEEIAELRRRFDRDKDRVQEMRNKRKFRPF